ncbi:hypothetical protein LLG07_04905 [bacterium]|nr:hypothetical protein [bacterium]
MPDDYEVNLFTSYIKENFADLSLAEFSEAFKLYVANKMDYKDKLFQNFTISFMENVVQSFKRLRMTIPRPTPQALPEKTPPTKEEQDIMAKKAALKRFSEYQDHMDFWDFGGVTYKYLVKRGLISLTREQKDKVKDQAIAQLTREAKKEIEAGKRPSEVNQPIEVILTGADQQVQIRCMKIALMDWFDGFEGEEQFREVLK